VGDAVLGIVANPLSGRDIRRLVAQASVFPTVEKANMVQRMLTAAGAVGVDEVLVSTDLGGISAAVLRAVRREESARRTSPWPAVRFIETGAITQSARDTTAAVEAMIAQGARVVACLGGDGTARVASAACGDVPLLPLSTGTNNAFPQMREATVAGLAAGLLATGAVSTREGTRRATVLVVRTGGDRGRRENALVDVAVARTADVGARALWDPGALTELYCTFAEPDGIGLSSIPGLLCPSPRSTPDGVALLLCPPASPEAVRVVHAPIAPGLVTPVGVRSWRTLRVGERVEVSTRAGVVAVDGEREIEFADSHRPTVTLRADGPVVVDIAAVLAAAARDGLLHRPLPPTPRSTP
jgi:predicted polyphosphate/ATP-dependent NAD kinase